MPPARPERREPFILRDFLRLDDCRGASNVGRAYGDQGIDRDQTRNRKCTFQRNSQRVSSRPEPDPAKRKTAEWRDPEDACTTMPSAGTSARNLRVVTFASFICATLPSQ